MTTVTISEKKVLAEWLGNVAEIARKKLQKGDVLITFPLSADMVDRFERAQAVIYANRNAFDAFAAGSGSDELREAFAALEEVRSIKGKPMSEREMLAVIDLLVKYGQTPEEWVRLMRGENKEFERELSKIPEDVL